jgi:lysyl-tRNA synthetase class 2
MTPWWRPESLERRRANLVARGRITAAVRGFFAERGFAEVETPALQVSPGLEPHLKAFATELAAPDGRTRQLHLQTSPEFAMKKLLVAGSGPIYQLARVWRNGERSPTHHPEFTMLEWYRPGAGYETLIEDCGDLLRIALHAAGGGAFAWQDRRSDPVRLERLTVAEAFQRHAAIDLMAGIAAGGATDRAALAAAAEAIGVRVVPADTWEDIFFRIFLDRIEPRLGHPHPTILIDYPIAMAALSRPKPTDPRLAERFELYVGGLELANAFGELTDAAEQRRRFEADRTEARRLYGHAYPIDEDFLTALAQGMPESAGIALGFDRLVMLATGAAHIEDVLWAPVAEV